MTFAQLKANQGEIIRLLENSVSKNRLVHAYLLEGDSGSGTEDLAKYVAMLLLCEAKQKPCLTCRSCQRIQADVHTNVLTIAPSGEMIKKDQVEALRHELSMTSLEDGPQITIVKDADQMNTAAANSLLKMLEEPANNHYILLLTKNHRRMLSTILSRAQLLHLKSLSTAAMIEELVHNGVNRDVAYVVSYLTTDIEQAKIYMSEGKAVQLLELAKRLLLAEIKKKDKYVEYFFHKDMLLNESDKMWHHFFLDVMLLIYQEMLKLAKGMKPDYFLDILKHLTRQGLDSLQMIKYLEKISQFKERLNYNVNLDLFYTSLFLE